MPLIEDADVVQTLREDRPYQGTSLDARTTADRHTCGVDDWRRRFCAFSSRLVIRSAKNSPVFTNDGAAFFLLLIVTMRPTLATMHTL